MVLRPAAFVPLFAAPAMFGRRLPLPAPELTAAAAAAVAAALGAGTLLPAAAGSAARTAARFVAVTTAATAAIEGAGAAVIAAARRLAAAPVHAVPAAPAAVARAGAAPVRCRFCRFTTACCKAGPPLPVAVAAAPPARAAGKPLMAQRAECARFRAWRYSDCLARSAARAAAMRAAMRPPAAGSWPLVPSDAAAAALPRSGLAAAPCSAACGLPSAGQPSNGNGHSMTGAAAAASEPLGAHCAPGPNRDFGKPRENTARAEGLRYDGRLPAGALTALDGAPALAGRGLAALFGGAALADEGFSLGLCSTFGRSGLGGCREAVRCAAAEEGAWPGAAWAACMDEARAARRREAILAAASRSSTAVGIVAAAAAASEARGVVAGAGAEE